MNVRSPRIEMLQIMLFGQESDLFSCLTTANFTTWMHTIVAMKYVVAPARSCACTAVRRSSSQSMPAYIPERHPLSAFQ